MKADWVVTVMHIHNLGAEKKKAKGGQHHALDGLPSGRRVGIPLCRRLGGPARMGRKILAPTVFRTPDRPTVASRYTD